MDAMKDLKYFLLIVVGLFVLWLFTGGPARYESAKPFYYLINKPVGNQPGSYTTSE